MGRARHSETIMADDLHYVPGDYYMICDRTGFKVRSNKMRQEWTGRMIRDKSWEARQPQDFVRGVPDPQAVPIPRPRQANVFLGPLETTVLTSAAAGSSVLFLTSTIRMSVGDTLWVMTDLFYNAVVKITDLISATEVQVSPNLPNSASAGNFVVDISAESLPFIG
jgi:hypothetical protein